MGRRAWALLALLAAQPLAAQRGWDVAGQATALVRDSTLLAGALGAGVRFPRGLRLSATAGPGWLTPDRLAGRGEVLLAYHLYPLRPSRPGWYVAGGIAGEMASGDVRGLLVALLGVEARPWRGGGLFAELGVGGGLRLAAGYRAIRLTRRR